MEVERRNSRSRSRTPFLGDVVDTDNASTAEASTRSTRRTEKPKPTNGLTNGAQDKKETVTTVTTETVTVIETKASKDSVNRSKVKLAGKKVAERDFSNKKTVEKDTTSKKGVQKEETMTKRQTASRKLPMETSDYSSDEEGKMRTISAYRAAGEWWETFPKTDFTYSPASRHRTQLVAPGVKALPNMSRRSLSSVTGPQDSAFVSRTATARKTGTPPTLPFDPNWLRGSGHPSLSQMSDGESDDDAFIARRSRTQTVTTVSVWTRITTVVVTCLVVADPRRLLRSLLDRLYLLVAYVRVLDARVLSALPWRPRRAWFVPLALILLLLLAASWLSINGGAAPLDSTSALLVQWLAPISAMLRLSANQEPAGHGGGVASANLVTAGLDSVATPMPFTQQQEAGAGWPAPALDLSDVAAQVAASATLRDWLSRQLSAAAEAQRRESSAELERRLRDALASAALAQETSTRAAVENLGRDAASLRAELHADWSQRQEEWAAAVAARVLASQPVRALLAAADVDALADKLLANGKLADKLLANGELSDKLLANGELADKLLANGELSDKLLASGELSERLVASGELSARLLADGELVEKLLANGDFVDKILANEEFSAKLVADGKLLEALLTNGELSAKLLANGELVDKLLANGQLTAKLLADGQLAAKLLADVDIAAVLLANGELVERLLADGGLAEKLLASGKFAGVVAAQKEPAEDERVKELQDQLALLMVTFQRLEQQVVVLKQAAPPPSPGPGPVAGGDVEALIAAMISRYDADKTGRADFALESLGGSVLSTRCSETHEAAAASLTLFNIPLWTHASSPRAAIQPGTLPGQCWAFKGARGFLVVQLSSLVRVTSVSIEHTPRALARNNRIDSAPRRMTLLGLAALDDPEPVNLGSFEFVEHGPSLQTFPVKSDDGVPALRIVELQIESNHGNQEYTCLYRFRVHGNHVDG